MVSEKTSRLVSNLSDCHYSCQIYSNIIPIYLLYKVLDHTGPALTPPDLAPLQGPDLATVGVHIPPDRHAHIHAQVVLMGNVRPVINAF